MHVLHYSLSKVGKVTNFFNFRVTTIGMWHFQVLAILTSIRISREKVREREREKKVRERERKGIGNVGKYIWRD